MKSTRTQCPEWRLRFLGSVATLCVLLISTAATSAEPAQTSFRRDVAPILVLKCLACHNDRKADSGLSLATVQSLKRGGKQFAEAIIEPHDPDRSYLIESIRPGAGIRMPFKQPPLTDPEIAQLTHWVKTGAPLDPGVNEQTPIASLVDIYRHLPRVALQAPAAAPVTSVAFSPAGQTLAAASGAVIKLFDVASGKPTGTLSGHPGPITIIKFTRDGHTLIAAGGRPALFGSITVWDVANQKPRLEWKGHSDIILAADITSDGQTLATASYDKQIQIWDLKTGKPIRVLRDHSDSVYSLAFSPDDKLLASCAADRTVKLWQWSTGVRTATLSESTAELYAVSFTPDGSRLISAGVDHSFRSYTLRDAFPRFERSVFAHDAPILRLAISPDGRQLASSAEDGSVRLWNLTTLAPLATLPKQPDWAQSLCFGPDSRKIALGSYDGSLTLWDPTTQKTLLTLQPRVQQAPSSPTPKLTTKATLDPLFPRAVTRATKLKFALTGRGVDQTTELLIPDSGISGSILPTPKRTPNRLDIELTIAANARIGFHSIGVVTPLGIPPAQPLLVDPHPERAEVEPNDQPRDQPHVSLPASLTGTIDRPGDTDLFPIDAQPGVPLIFKAMTRSLGSALRPDISVVDARGQLVAELPDHTVETDPVLTFNPRQPGRYFLRVADRDFAGSPTHHYRIIAGALPYAQSVFPLGVERGQKTTITLDGLNLGTSRQIELKVDRAQAPRQVLPIADSLPNAPSILSDARVVVAEGPQLAEDETLGGSTVIQSICVPGGVSGRISRPGDVDTYGFQARKNETVIVELFGERLGSSIDSVIEVLDEQGRSIPRALLRITDRTETAFRDHNASVTGIRLTHWENLAINDYLLIGREVVRIRALPRTPDDDCSLWSESGRRIAMFETTPEQHPQGQPIYRVERESPDATITPGGTTPRTLHFANDDAGPVFLKDSRITFVPPRDGRYQIQVKDARGLGGKLFGYHLVLRRPAPSFDLGLATKNINIPRGSTERLTVQVVRHDGFDEPIELRVAGAPDGITTTTSVVDRAEVTGVVSFTADTSAPAFSSANWRLIATPIGESSPAEHHEPKSVEARGGLITVTPEPNLKIIAQPSQVTLRPGERVTLNLAVERAPAFAGRVPIDVSQLPQGVRVLDIGLNGVLITEKQTHRSVTIIADPWVQPMTRFFFAIGKAESAGTAHTSAPIQLKIIPNDQQPQLRSAAVKPAQSG